LILDKFSDDEEFERVFTSKTYMEEKSLREGFEPAFTGKN